MSRMFTELLTILASTAIFVNCDRFLTENGYQKPYYAVHVLHNAMVVALTSGDVWVSLTDINRALTRPIAWNAVYICYALHFYHLYEYWRSFHMDDWLHHVLMIGVALPLGSLARSGALMGTSLFFMTGLPGGINYALLFAERNRWITKETEKAVNVPVHMWLRSPGCVATAALTIAAMSASPTATGMDRFAAIVVAALTFWNGVYFANQVVRADERRRALSRLTGAVADANNAGHIQANPMQVPAVPQ